MEPRCVAAKQIPMQRTMWSLSRTSRTCFEHAESDLLFWRSLDLLLQVETHNQCRNLEEVVIVTDASAPTSEADISCPSCSC